MAEAPQGSGADTRTAVPAREVASARRIALRAVLLAGGSGLVYLLMVGSFRFEFKQTRFPHHILMSDAMLHGQLHVRSAALEYKRHQTEAGIAARVDQHIRSRGETVTAAERATRIREATRRAVRHDWAAHEGRLYGYWSPLTPALMMPFVAVWGIEVSDQLINVLFGAMNVGLFYWLLRRVDHLGLCRTEESCRVALTVVLAFGTVHFWLTCAGQVWFAVQIVTLTALLAALLAVCCPANRGWHYLLGGLFFGAAVLGRNIIMLVGLFFVVLIWIRGRVPPAGGPTPRGAPRRARASGGRQRAARRAGARPLRTLALRVVLFCLPVAGAVGLQGVYNYARFGDVFENGLGIQIRTGGNPRFLNDYEQYGMFSLHYVPRNLYYYFWNYDTPRLGDGRIWYDVDGNSVFLLTPPLLYVFLVWRRPSLLTLALLCGVVPLMGALLAYFATGWCQFGPRYLLDLMPLLLLLAALGMRGRLTHVGYVLVVLAVAANLFGTYRMCDEEFEPLRQWVRWWTLPALVGLGLLGGVLTWYHAWRRAALPGAQ